MNIKTNRGRFPFYFLIFLSRDFEPLVLLGPGSTRRLLEFQRQDLLLSLGRLGLAGAILLEPTIIELTFGLINQHPVGLVHQGQNLVALLGRIKTVGSKGVLAEHFTNAVIAFLNLLGLHPRGKVEELVIGKVAETRDHFRLRESESKVSVICRMEREGREWG
jgi:hypothetical protein